MMFTTRKVFKTWSCLFIFISGFAAAENWPEWRGPRRDGTSTETGLPTKWSKTENIIWRLDLPGPAAATPVVWGDRIFVTSTENDSLVLLCISTNGKILWKKTVGIGNSNARVDEGNFAAPSPSTDGKYVWVFFGSGDLACFDFEGNPIWKTNLQERYGEFSLNFVMASTPLLDGGRLYLQLLHSEASLVLALDKMNGREIWKQERQSDARAESEHSYASPFLYRDGKNEFLLVHGADYITAHQLSDGSEIWRCGGLNPKTSYNPSLRFVASPVATTGLIIVPSAKNGPVLALKPDSTGDVTASKEQYLWVLERGSTDVPSPLIQGGLVYLLRENGDIFLLDAKSGQLIYQEHTDQGRYRASPVYADGRVYITGRHGVITVVKAGRQFEILSKNDLGESIAASPVISNGKIYLRTYEALYAVGVSKSPES
jgi:outer membrane protein assembly factor BamB